MRNAERRRTHINNHGRLVEVRPVEEIERFPTELEIEALVLAEARVLGDSQIRLRHARADDRVTALGSEAQRARRQVHKCTRGRMASRIAAVNDVAVRIASVVGNRPNQIRPVCDTVAVHVSRHRCRNREASLHRGDKAHFPAPHDLVQYRPGIRKRRLAGA